MNETCFWDETDFHDSLKCSFMKENHQSDWTHIKKKASSKIIEKYYAFAIYEDLSHLENVVHFQINFKM